MGNERKLYNAQSDLEFSRFEREKIQTAMVALIKEGKSIPTYLEQEAIQLDKEIASLEDRLTK